MASPYGELPNFDALWNYEQPATTEQAFLDVLQRTSETAPPAYRWELLTQIARTLGLQRRFAEAHATLDQVQEGLKNNELTVPRIRYLLERGRVFNSSGQVERSRPLFREAWEVATAHAQDAYAVDAAHMLGIVEQADQGIAWNQKALALAQASEDPQARGWQGSLLNNIGWTYHNAGAYEQALGMFLSALEAWERDEPDLARIARWAVARALRSLGRIPESLARQRDLLQALERAGARDGYVHEEIGECLLLLGRVEEAQPHFARAFEVLSQDVSLAATEPERLERLRALATSGK